MLKLPLRRAVKLITVAAEAEAKEHYYRQYLAYLPFMAIKGEIKSFEELYKEYSQNGSMKIDARPKDEIMREILKIGG